MRYEGVPNKLYPLHVSLFVIILLLTACGSSNTSTGSKATSSTTPTIPATPTASVPTISTALVTYNGHTGPVIGISWSPDGKYIASCGNDGTVQVWDAKTGAKRWQASISHYAFAVAWSPDGQKIAGGGGDGSITILNATSGHVLATYQHQTGFIEGVSWSPDSKSLVSGSQDKTADVWNVQTGKLLFTYKGHSDAVERVAWSPDGSRIASASYDQTVQVWDAKTGKTLVTYKGHSAPVWEVAWSHDSKRIVSGTGSAGINAPVSSGNSVKVWDATTGQTLVTYNGNGFDGQTYALAWSPDDKRIASGGDGIYHNYARVWDASTGQMIVMYHGHSDIVFDVAWSPEGSMIASASVDGTVQVWKPQT